MSFSGPTSLPLLQEARDLPVAGVRCWTAHLDSLAAAELAELHTHLDSAESERAARFHLARDRDRYAATRALLRGLLAAALGESPSAIAIAYGAHGKPALVDNNLHFNVSHSAGWAMFALAFDVELGIDLESAVRFDKNDDELRPLATRVLSARELTGWEDMSDHTARRAALLRAWVRKEACVKASGRGLAEGLTEIETSGIIAPVLMSNWIVHDVAAPNGFAAALAINSVESRNGNASSVAAD